MFFVTETYARRRFKDLLGNANHLLITILVGLSGVEKGRVGLDADFHAAWNPQDVVSSARRSRAFALDLGLVRSVDALEVYMSCCNRKPFAIHETSFRDAMNEAGRSVWNKLGVFLFNLPGADPCLVALNRSAIAWRNRGVHSLAENEISTGDRQTLLSNEDSISSQFRGLSARELLKNFDAKSGPTFKEVAGFIHAAQRIVQYFDGELIRRLDPVTLLKQLLRSELCSEEVRPESVEKHMMRRAVRIWGRDEERRPQRIESLVRTLGFSPEDSHEYGTRIPDATVAKLFAFSPKEAVEFANSEAVQATRSG